MARERALSRSKLSRKEVLEIIVLTSSTYDNAFNTGIKLYKALSFLSSYQDSIGMPFSGLKEYDYGELSIIIISS